MDAPRTKRNKPLSPRALTLIDTLKRWCRGADKAHTDETLSRMTAIPQRSLVDVAGELLDAGHPVLASCDQSKPGRYLSNDSREVRRHGRNLIVRGIKIIRRGRMVTKAADAMDARKKVEPTGQMRMFT